MPRRFGPTRPFTRAAALSADITDAVLRGPDFRRLFTGVHIRSDVTVWPTTDIETALLLHPAGAFASHFSAARSTGFLSGQPPGARERVREE